MKELTNQQRQVMIHLAAGESYKGMAILMDLSLNTVKTYVKQAFEALGARSGPEAVAKYYGERVDTDKLLKEILHELQKINHSLSNRDNGSLDRSTYSPIYAPRIRPSYKPATPSRR